MSCKRADRTNERGTKSLDRSRLHPTVFRNRGRPSHVCLWFGGDEYEGIDPRRPYAYDSRTECLEDDEGFDIHWRTVGVDQSDSEDSDDDEE